MSNYFPPLPPGLEWGPWHITWGMTSFYPAQGIEAGTDETQSGSAEGESPVSEADAPKP